MTEYSKELYEKSKERMREYYYANKEKIIKQNSEYRKNNIEHYREVNAKREKERRKIKRYLINSFTPEEWERCKQYFNNKCAYCGKEGKLTKEHFIPITQNGDYTNDNIIPVCKSCNSSKLNKTFEEWYTNKEFYSEERISRIYEYINYHKALRNKNIEKIYLNGDYTKGDLQKIIDEWDINQKEHIS